MAKQNLLADWPHFTLEQSKEIAITCSSYERLPALLKLWGFMDESDWLTVLGQYWSCCDNIAEHVDGLWDSPIGMRAYPIREMMDEDELAVYENLPDEIIVYRGCYKRNKWGLSWTLEESVARKFPFLTRYYKPEQQAILVKAIAKKSSVIAIKLDRNESELITCRPKHISEVGSIG